MQTHTIGMRARSRGSPKRLSRLQTRTRAAVGCVRIGGQLYVQFPVRTKAEQPAQGEGA
jgi:hypothetical protein